MSDVLHQVLTQIGAVFTKLEHIEKRNEEDRRDAGRHRENQRAQGNEMREDIRSISDRVTRMEPIVEDLHRQGQRKKFVRELVVKVARYLPFFSAVFMSWFLWFLGIFDRVKTSIAALTR